ncbi:DUF4192 domain-containing protein [Candidatus Blastococcus massiliensis]|uniref:DUF4192 domain-containing protein n=1 Tax=Candidatus Blastococcus massiliensis TaxID=1470358 RepID=UPI0004B0CAE4|nr:DUF4192 domain-containing protein [Candidatus Blastococcus massiliensis]
MDTPHPTDRPPPRSSTLPDGPPAPDPVRVGDPGELAAGLPHLLGYRPDESVVLIGLGGESGRRVGLTVRADLPAAAHRRALASALADSLGTDDPRGAVALVLSELPDEPWPGTGLPHRALVHDLVLALDAAGIPLEQALLVRGGRWWDFDCPHPCCGPGAGTLLPAEVGQIEAASVAAGTVVAGDRSALEQRIARPGAGAQAAMRSACLRTVEELAQEPSRQARAEASRRLIRRAVERCRPGPDSERLPDDDVARILWGLREVAVRDWSLQLSLADDAAAAEVLWTECTRRAPSPLDAAPATLLAVSAWLRGDGAMANIAVDRALDSDPDYSLAALIADALAACVPPSRLRAFLVEAARWPEDLDPAGMPSG